MSETIEEELFPDLYHPELIHKAKLMGDAIAGQALACDIEDEQPMQ